MAYTVTFTVTGLYDVVVDAPTPEKAVELASRELPVFNRVFQGDLMDAEVRADIVTDDDCALYDIDTYVIY